MASTGPQFQVNLSFSGLLHSAWYDLDCIYQEHLPEQVAAVRYKQYQYKYSAIYIYLVTKVTIC